MLVAHGIRALREAQSIIIELSHDIEPGTVDQVQTRLATAVEHASIAYRTLITMAGE